MGTLIGYNVGAVIATSTNTVPVAGGGKGFTVGSRLTTHNGKEYVYAQCNTAVGVGAVVGIASDTGVATGLVTSGAGGVERLGVAPVAFASGDYGWMQIDGACTVKVLGSAVKNIALFTTSTAGALDDATASNFRVDGLVLLSTNPSATATTLPAFISYPRVLGRAGPA